ncbi:MAG TPA: phosphoribosyltransferase family protein [Anaerolineae bacterium]|nr:phosphoribosyltransferase family protein [Anaerolineae bacterium]
MRESHPQTQTTTKMTSPSYDYTQRAGVLPISWNDFHGLCKALALGVQSYQPQIILAVGRGGYYPGTLLAHMLRIDVFPVYLTRRVNDQVVRNHPQWIVEPPSAVAGKRVLIVDEISSSGATVRLVCEKALALAAAAARVAVLYAHSWGTEMPDYIGLVSDALILNPWDREVLTADGFAIHPEYRHALEGQGLAPDGSYLVDAPSFILAKG